MSFAACAEIVRRGDPERFLSVMAAPVRLRSALFATYAFNVEVSRAPWVTAEPMIAEMRLQWWADMLDEFRAGGPVRRHEVATPLAAVLNQTAAAYLADLVQARRLDVSREPLEDWAQARAYVRQSSGNLMAAAAAATGAVDGLEAVATYGMATGMANYMIAQPAMAAQGRHRLDRMDDPESVARFAGRALMDARAARRSLPRAAIPAARAGWLGRRRLAAIARDPACLDRVGPAISEFGKRAGLLWRSALGRA